VTGRREAKSVLVAIIELAGTVLIIWLMSEDDQTVKPKLWHAVMRASQRAAHLFGRVALHAEARYREEIQP
jgi:hypothetical protein